MHTPLVIKYTKNVKSFPWHPSIVYVEEGWNGHKWWMAESPLPPMDMEPYRDRWELPCIHYSDDGVYWNTISNNPIDDIDEEMILAHNYLSDPHLVMRDSILECWYRLSLLNNRTIENNKTILLKKISVDGVNWSERIVVADLRNENDKQKWGSQIISQSLIWADNHYMCWYVDRSGYLNGRKIRYISSMDSVNWEESKECVLCGPLIDPWHIDVQKINGYYQMIIYDLNELTWWESKDGLNFSFVSWVLCPTRKFPYTFYADGLYRACIVYVKKMNTYHVFFSGKLGKHSYIGLLKTEDRKCFYPQNGVKSPFWFWRLFEHVVNISFLKLKCCLKLLLKVVSSL